MDIPTRKTLFQLLPNELVAEILAMLDYRDLAFCMQVCKRMLDLVSSSSLLQYHLELGRSYMEDGPLSRMSISERRERLQAHINAWRNVRWSSCVHLFDMHPQTFAMGVAPGGILSFTLREEGKIKFVQLPSNIRGIPMRQWEHSFPFPPSLFALDPSEDILVVLQHVEWHFHFLSLRSGGPHPLAALFRLSDPPHFYRDTLLLQLVVARNYVAVLIPKYQVRVCDWKTGQTVLCITSPGVRSVAILPENRILLASTHASNLARRAIPEGGADDPVLAVYNLDQVQVPPSGRKRVILRRAPAAVFALELGRHTIPGEMLLHYRLNIHSYSPDVAVPFFGSHADQLVALQTSSYLIQSDSTGFRVALRHILLIPVAKLLCHVGTTEGRRTRYIQWNDWGATESCRLPDPRFSDLFRSAISGSRFIPFPESHNFISVWDFSRARARAAQLRTRVLEPVPCIQKEVALPIEITGRVITAISEDVIVICESRTFEERVYLLVF